MIITHFLIWPIREIIASFFFQEEPISGFKVGTYLEYMQQLETKYRKIVLPDMLSIAKWNNPPNARFSSVVSSYIGYFLSYLTIRCQVTHDVDYDVIAVLVSVTSLRRSDVWRCDARWPRRHVGLAEHHPSLNLRVPHVYSIYRCFRRVRMNIWTASSSKMTPIKWLNNVLLRKAFFASVSLCTV